MTDQYDSFSSQRFLQTPYPVEFKPHLEELTHFFSSVSGPHAHFGTYYMKKRIKFFIVPFPFSSASVVSIISSSVRV